MMIERFYTLQATVMRLSRTANKTAYASIGFEQGHLQQASANIVIQTASRYSLSHLFWCRVDAAIQVNDELTIELVKYSVKAIFVNSFGDNTHKEVHLAQV